MTWMIPTLVAAMPIGAFVQHAEFEFGVTTILVVVMLFAILLGAAALSNDNR